MSKARDVKSSANTNMQKVIESSTTCPGKLFASLFKTNSKMDYNSQKKKSPIIEEFMNLAKYFLEPEELSLDKEINRFLTDYRNMSKTEAKPEFLRLLNKVKSIYGP